MYIIYEGNLTPGSLPVANDPQFRGAATGIFKLPLDCLYLNIYNISPHRLTFSFSGGQNDWYFPPNAEAEGIYIGKQGGANLSLAPKMQSAVNLQITNLFTLSSLQNVTGVLAIMGFKEGEIWQGRRPIVTGSIVPTQGANVANQLVNVGNTSGTNIINASSSPGTGSIQVDNDGSRVIKLLDNGISTTYENLQNGTNLTPPIVAYGAPSNLPATTFNGVGNFGNTTIGALINAGNVPTVGHWVSVAHITRKQVTVNTATTILSISAPATGTYRANISIAKANATSSAITCNIAWNDPLTGAQTRNFSCDNAGAYLNLRGSTALVATVLPCFPIVFDATTSTTITITYTDPSGVANDSITADLELFVV